ncbi:MAG: hypothetical protein D6767_00760, partial [Candidatus Hydrogenedentota bacterium]
MKKYPMSIFLFVVVSLSHCHKKNQYTCHKTQPIAQSGKFVFTTEKNFLCKWEMNQDKIAFQKKDVNTAQFVQAVKLKDKVTRIAFTQKTNKTIAVAYPNGEICLLDFNSLITLKCNQSTKGKITQLEFVDNDRFLHTIIQSQNKKYPYVLEVWKMPILQFGYTYLGQTSPISFDHVFQTKGIKHRTGKILIVEKNGHYKIASWPRGIVQDRYSFSQKQKMISNCQYVIFHQLQFACIGKQNQKSFFLKGIFNPNQNNHFEVTHYKEIP